MSADLTSGSVQTESPTRGRCVRGGSSPAHPLLVNLLSYWKMGEAYGQTRVDSFGANNLLDVQGNVSRNNLGIANLANFSAYFTQTYGKALQAASTTAFAQGAGQSFTLAGWLYWADLSSSNVVGTWGTTGAQNCFTLFNNGSTQLVWNVDEVGGTQKAMVVAGPTSGAVFHIAVGYDDVAQQLWASFNAGARQNLACAGAISSPKKLTFGCWDSLDSYGQSSYQDWGFWKRTLSASDLTLLYGAGGGRPFEQF